MINQCTLYVESGALVLNGQGTNLPEFLSIDDSSVNVEVPGTYYVIYTAADNQVGPIPPWAEIGLMTDCVSHTNGAAPLPQGLG